MKWLFRWIYWTCWLGFEAKNMPKTDAAWRAAMKKDRSF